MNKPISLHKILFFCFTGLVSVPAIVLVIWLERSVVDSSIEGVKDKHLVLAQSISLAISRYVRDVESIFNYVRGEYESGETLHGKLGLFADTRIRYIVRMDREFTIDRRTVRDGDVPFGRLPANMRNALSDTLAAARKQIGKPILSPVVFNQKRSPSIYFITAETDGGYTMAEIGTGYMVELQKGIKFGNGGHAAIVDGLGHVLAHPIQSWRDSIRDISAIEPVKKMIAGRSGVLVYDSPATNKTMIAGYLTEPKTGWGIMVPQPYQELIAEARRNLTGEIVIIVIATLLASIASWWLSRQLVAPIQRIADAAKGYQQSRSMVSVPEIETPMPQEIRVLAQAYNSLIESAGEQQRELEIRVEQRTADLRGEVVERKRIEQKLREQQAQLAHFTRLGTMGEMATGFAHELNQPLSAICAYIDGSINRLRESAGASDDIIQALEKASEQAQRAGMVIRRIRDFVQDKEREFDEIDLNETVRDAAGLLENEAQLGTVAIDLNLSSSDLAVYADFVQIQQVILNLGRNAIDSMLSIPAESRKVVIQTYVSDDGSVNVTVQDSGSGLDPEVIDHIFDPFFTTKPEGLGMGLAICKSIAEVHGGRIWYRPLDGNGSIFGLTLPKEIQPRDA